MTTKLTTEQKRINRDHKLRITDRTGKNQLFVKTHDDRVLHLIDIHSSKTCGQCVNFNADINKCIRRKIIVEPDFQQCEVGEN